MDMDEPSLTSIYILTLGLIVFVSLIFSSEDRENSSYRLVGIMEHMGYSLNSGHFVAYVRVSSVGSNKQLSSDSSSWFCANDGDIRQVSLEEVLKCEAFVLFYERWKVKMPNQPE
jgi:uncharacterized UBP type Zn finger protein